MSDQDWCPLGDRGTKLELHEARVDSDKWVEIYRVRRGGWNVAVHNGSLTGDLVARGTGRGRAFRVGLEEYVRLTEGVEYGMREPVRKRSRSLRAASVRKGAKAMETLGQKAFREGKVTMDSLKRADRGDLADLEKP